MDKNNNHAGNLYERCAIGILNWPEETAPTGLSVQPSFSQRDSNQVLDFHGDPVNADFCLLSDGNHHMALQEAVTAFAAAEPELGSVFYVTLPPPALRTILQTGSISIGNLQFPVSPDMLICPEGILEDLEKKGVCGSPRRFVSCQGYAWLVAKSNPKKFLSITDLGRDDIRLFLSNPNSEKVSFQNYCSALMTMSETSELSAAQLKQNIDSGKGIHYGECIHHREAPESIVQGLADVSLLYHHLALRFARIFPQYFELLITPELEALNQALGDKDTQIKMALLGDGGKWGQTAATFFQSQKVAEIYRHHGLLARLTT